MAAGAAYACGAAAMPWVDYAHVCAVPYSDAYAMPRSRAAADAHACAVPGAMADADALPNAYAVSDAYAMPNAYAVSDAYAGAVAVSAVLPVPATSVPHNAGAEPHAAGSRIP